MVVHLSVHPSGWRGNPPQIEKETKAEVKVEKGKEKEKEVPEVPRPTPTTKTAPPATSFLLWKHREALSKLTHTLFTEPKSGSRTLAISFVTSHGYIWPAVLDESYPATSEKGVEYVRVVIE